MARTSTKPLAFFRHDANSAEDRKIKFLLKRHGMEGYGRWWRLCEILASEPDQQLEMQTEEDAEMLADDLMLGGAAEALDFLRDLKSLGLLEMPGDGTVSNKRMREYGNAVRSKSAARKRAAETRWGKA